MKRVAVRLSQLVVVHSGASPRRVLDYGGACHKLCWGYLVPELEPSQAVTGDSRVTLAVASGALKSLP